ncbi:MAG TPA: transcriptional regulator [Brevibacillus sp.]|nr:transcriptional regulator [Brevibacillus sp.]
MFGLGKQRSRLGKYLDDNDIPQQWLVDETKLNKKTISQLASKDEPLPSGATMKKILQALRKKDKGLKQEDFWPM